MNNNENARIVLKNILRRAIVRAFAKSLQSEGLCRSDQKSGNREERGTGQKLIGAKQSGLKNNRGYSHRCICIYIPDSLPSDSHPRSLVSPQKLQSAGSITSLTSTDSARCKLPNFLYAHCNAIQYHLSQLYKYIGTKEKLLAY